MTAKKTLQISTIFCRCYRRKRLKNMLPDRHAADHKETDEHKDEADDRQERHLPAPPPHRPEMQKHKIGDPGDERPRLFRVPAPVRSPGDLRPDGSGDHPECEQRPAERDRLVSKRVHHLERRQPAKDRAPLLGLELALLYQVHDGNDKGESKCRVTKDRERRMDPEPTALEYRLYFFYLSGN